MSGGSYTRTEERQEKILTFIMQHKVVSWMDIFRYCTERGILHNPNTLNFDLSTLRFKGLANLGIDEKWRAAGT
jgi:hypothetical protein